MDPNANLIEQRQLAGQILRVQTYEQEDVIRLAELVDALDDWIRKGGFLPVDWKRDVVDEARASELSKADAELAAGATRSLTELETEIEAEEATTDAADR